MKDQPVSEVTIPAMTTGDDEAQSNQSKELAIQTLLEIIDSNDIPIDDSLRRAILGQHEIPYTADDARVSIQGTTKSHRRRPAALKKRESIWGFFMRKHSAEVAEETNIEKEIAAELNEKFGESWFDNMSFECRVKDGSYCVDIPSYFEEEPPDLEDVELQEQYRKRRRSSLQQNHIPTVTNTGGAYKPLSALKRFLTTGSCQQPYETKVIMKDINLVFEEGKMYLILGAPKSGKSTLLKMIAGRLPQSGNGCYFTSSGPRKSVTGDVEVNGINSRDEDIVWANVVSYVDQIERLHGYLTVKETVDFAFDCCWGSTHRGPFFQSTPEADAILQEVDNERFMVDLILRAVGIKGVADTFVGNESVRGVSGGEKKRASVAETLAAKACELVIIFALFSFYATSLCCC